MNFSDQDLLSYLETRKTLHAQYKCTQPVTTNTNGAAEKADTIKTMAQKARIARAKRDKLPKDSQSEAV